MKKFFKKTVFFILALVFFLPFTLSIAGCNNSREEILRLYVPGEYITDDILLGFEDWYKNATGKNITVIKKEFDTNETMYTMVAQKHQDYDVICPSDYMLERMRKEGLLLKLDEDVLNGTFVDVNGSDTDLNDNPYSGIRDNILGEKEDPTDETEEYPNQSLVDLIQNSFDPDFEYSTPYMWGTMGIMYYCQGDLDSFANVTSQDNTKSSWTSVFDVNKQNIYMKDSERDTFTSAMLYYYNEDLKQALENMNNASTEEEYDLYKAEYDSIMFEIYNLGDNFDEKLANAQKVLQDQKPYVYDYETDEGKDDLLTTKGKQGYYGVFWSCDAGYIMADWVGDEVTYSSNFRYLVPEEGSNVWIDAYCIPKYAKNVRAANLFLMYISNPAYAFDCMDYTGCTSATYQTTLDYLEYLYPEVLRDGTYSLEEFLELSDDDLLSLELIDEDGEYTFEPVFLQETPDSFKAMYLSLMFPNLDITVGDYSFSSPLSHCGIMRDLGLEASDKLSTMWSTLRREIVTPTITNTTLIILGCIATATLLGVAGYFTIKKILDNSVKKDLAKLK